MRLQIEAAKMRLRDIERSSDIRRKLGAEPPLLHDKRSQLRWALWAPDQDASWVFSLGGFPRDPGVDPEHSREVMYLIWLGNASGSPRRSWKALLGRGTSGLPCSACCHRNPALDKQQKMDGWISDCKHITSV